MSELDQVQVSGPGLTHGQTGKRCVIYFSGLPLNLDDSTLDLDNEIICTFDGPSTTELMFERDKIPENGKIEAYYVPLVPGEYMFTLRYKKQELPGCPFMATITGKVISAKKLLSKVRVHGNAITVGKALMINEFLVDCSMIKPVIGNLKVHIKGPARSSAHLDIADHKNGTYSVFYKPIRPGVYMMDIKIADTHIPESPFKIRVLERSNSCIAWFI